MVFLRAYLSASRESADLGKKNQRTGGNCYWLSPEGGRGVKEGWKERKGINRRSTAALVRPGSTIIVVCYGMGFRRKRLLDSAFAGVRASPTDSEQAVEKGLIPGSRAAGYIFGARGSRAGRISTGE